MTCTTLEEGANRIAGIYDFIEWLYEEGPEMETMPRKELFERYVEAVMRRNRPDDPTVAVIRAHRESPSMRDRVRNRAEPGVRLLAPVIPIESRRKT